jgi:hypothetical protein
MGIRDTGIIKLNYRGTLREVSYRALDDRVSCSGEIEWSLLGVPHHEINDQDRGDILRQLRAHFARVGDPEVF